MTIEIVAISICAACARDLKFCGKLTIIIIIASYLESISINSVECIRMRRQILKRFSSKWRWFVRASIWLPFAGGDGRKRLRATLEQTKRVGFLILLFFTCPRCAASGSSRRVDDKNEKLFVDHSTNAMMRKQIGWDFGLVGAARLVKLN